MDRDTYIVRKAVWIYSKLYRMKISLVAFRINISKEGRKRRADNYKEYQRLHKELYGFTPPSSKWKYWSQWSGGGLMPLNIFNIYSGVIGFVIKKSPVLPIEWYVLSIPTILILGVFLAYRLSLYRGWHEFRLWGLGPKEVQIRRRMLGEPAENKRYYT